MLSYIQYSIHIMQYIYIYIYIINTHQYNISLSALLLASVYYGVGTIYQLRPL